MAFWLKKAVSYWFMPLPFCLLLFVIGLLLSFSAKHARSGRRLVASAVLLLLLYSNKTISVWLVQPFESAYPAVPELVAGAPLPAALAPCRYVVILGSGHNDDDRLAPTSQLCTSAQARVIEGVRLLRALPAARLIATGPGRPGHPSHAAILIRSATILGANTTEAVALDQVRDTEDESLAIKAVVGEAPFALVTTAWHMPRAMKLMHHAGLHAVACPANYTAHELAPSDWSDALWDVESLERSTAAVHEALGLAWTWLKTRA